MKSEKQFLEECKVVAWEWIRARYELDPTARPCRTIFSPTRHGSAYFYESGAFGHRGPLVRVRSKHSSVYFNAYHRKRVGAISTRSVYVGRMWAIILQLIHEYTHYVQHLEGRPYSEVETARNEIAFAKSQPELRCALKTLKPYGRTI